MATQDVLKASFEKTSYIASELSECRRTQTRSKYPLGKPLEA